MTAVLPLLCKEEGSYVMYYELERILNSGGKVVVTGLAGSGKSTLISKFFGRYNTLRNANWFSTQTVDKDFYRDYFLFDRNPWIDRYALVYNTDDALELCVQGYIDALPDTYILLMLNNRWKDLRKGGQVSSEEINRQVSRYLKIVKRIWETGKISGVLVTTPKNFRSTEFCSENDFWDKCEKETMT